MDVLFDISAELLSSLLKKIKKLKKERALELQELKNIFGDPYDLAKYYVIPQCQQVNPANEDEDEASPSIRSDLFDVFNNFLNRNFKIQDGRHQLFILSDAGMGKSSLLIMLRLYHLLSFWPKDYECKLLKLGEDTEQQIKIIKVECDQTRTVLLLDSLDEDPVAIRDVNKRIRSLLINTKSFYRVIITCRTQFFPETKPDQYGKGWRVLIDPFSCPVIYLSLFDNKRIEEYLNKRFPKSIYELIRFKDSKNIIKAEKIIKNMGSLSFRPLLLSHIEDILDLRESRWNEYAIYETLVFSWLRREERKLIESGVDNIGVQALFLGCIIVATYMQYQEKRNIEEASISMLMKKNTPVKYIKDFNFGGRSLLNRNSDGSYRFSHYSIQEFILAYAICHNDRKHSISVLKEKNIPCTDMLLKFLINGPKTNNQFTNIIIDKNIINNCKDFKGSVSFPGINLSLTDLSGRTFKNSNFENVIFKHANLSKVTFINSNFEGADFSDSNLSGAKFHNCSAISAVFNCANLSRSNYVRTNLDNADLSLADLDKSIFYKSNLNGVNFGGAKNITSSKMPKRYHEYAIKHGVLLEE